jgi:pilus assembly protein CpaE
MNRFEQRLFGSGLRKSDIEQALGEDFIAAIPNHYSLVREAIDRGVPLDDVKAGNKITQQLKKLIAPPPQPDKGAAAQGAAAQKKLAFSWGRT